MNILAREIVEAARSILIDEDAATWSNDFLLGALNEGLRTVALVKPDAYTLQDFIPLAAGVLQELPPDGTSFMELTMNEDGDLCIECDKSLLDANNFAWGRATPEHLVQDWASDPRNPRRFYVSPPNDGTGSVEVLYGAIPPVLMYLDEEIPVQSIYQAPLTAWVLMRAWMMNSQKQDLTKSAAQQQTFNTLLGLRSQAQVAVAPRVNQVPGR